MKPEIRLAKASDLPAVLTLLAASALPSDDLSAANLELFCVAEADGQLIGVAGLEIAGASGLLRSVAVAGAFRNEGVARELIDACETLARKMDIVALYLIAADATASSVFKRLGYCHVERVLIPAMLRKLPEFTCLCPQTSPCLRKILNHEFDEAASMKTLEVFDPAMCCSTGVCGVDVDPALVQFAADLQWVGEQGVDVKRYNLGQEPQAFAGNAAVLKEIEVGMDRLPIIVVDGQIVSTGVHLTRAQLAQKLGLTAVSQDVQSVKASSGCCNPNSGCC